MKKLLSLFLFTIIYTLGITQESISIDIVTYGNENNTEFDLKKMATNVIEKKKDGCVTYTVVDNLESATSPYIFEIWDSEEFLTQYTFKQSREKEVTEGTQKVKKRYTAAGINVRAIYNVIGRLIERENGNVIDVFRFGGTLDREFAVDEVKKKYRMKYSENKEFNDLMLEKHAQKIEAFRDSTIRSVESSLQNAITEPVSDYLLAPPKVTGIAKQKGDKVKKVNIEYCPEANPFKHGLIYHPIIQEVEISGLKAYKKVASYYGSQEPGVVGIRKGEKELLPLLKGGIPLLATKPNKIKSSRLTANKSEEAQKVAFVTKYPIFHSYSDYELKYIELLLQSSLLGYNNIMVIANDKFTESLNETFTKPGREKEKEATAEDILNSSSVKSIWVDVSNMKNPVDVKSNSFLGQPVAKAPEGTKYILLNTSVTFGEDEYNDMFQISGVSVKNGLDFNSRRLSMDKTLEPLLDLSLEIVDIQEEKKGKVETVLVKSHEMLDEKDKYRVYNKENVTKKTKSLAELKLTEIVGNNLAIAKVTKGNKELKSLMAKPMYIYPHAGGLMSQLGGSADGPESSAMRSIKIRVRKL